ncbi:hypothetical protein MMC06_005680, partial [Schaereria dolodes]|nr:hypothetical protein [Schaereria dolodes]
MRLSYIPSSLLSLIAIVLTSIPTSYAVPYSKNELIIQAQNHTLELRQCSNPCGVDSQYCCAADQACYTVANVASCGSGVSTTQPATVVQTATVQANTGNGEWQYFTSTFVETDLVTSITVYSSFIPYTTPTQQTVVVTSVATVAAPVVTGAVCNAALNEAQCGSICCTSDQFCQSPGVCAAYGGSSANEATYYTTTSGVSAFIRPTSNTVQTVTSTGSATTTVAFQTAVGTDGSAITGMQITKNNGLSGGAIAGIVIGVIAGLLLLILFCLCCCAKGLVDALRSFFGLGRSRRRVTEETYIEERRSSRRHGSAAPAGGRTWYGAQRAGREQQKQSSGLAGFGGVAAGLTALAVLLGLKRRRDRQRAKTEYSGSSYSYSDYTSS